MGPLIDAELERVDRRHAQLTRLSTELVDALNLYHQVPFMAFEPSKSSYIKANEVQYWIKSTPMVKNSLSQASMDVLWMLEIYLWIYSEVMTDSEKRFQFFTLCAPPFVDIIFFEEDHSGSTSKVND